MTTTDDTATRSREVAYQLLAEGVQPTWRAIRDRTGQGSATTINNALQEFWAEVGRRLSRPDLTPAVADLCQALWQRALDDSDRRWVDEREGLQRELVTVRESLAASEAKYRDLLTVFSRFHQ